MCCFICQQLYNSWILHRIIMLALTLLLLPHTNTYKLAGGNVCLSTELFKIVNVERPSGICIPSVRPAGHMASCHLACEPPQVWEGCWLSTHFTCQYLQPQSLAPHSDCPNSKDFLTCAFCAIHPPHHHHPTSPLSYLYRLWGAPRWNRNAGQFQEAITSNPSQVIFSFADIAI